MTLNEALEALRNGLTIRKVGQREYEVVGSIEANRFSESCYPTHILWYRLDEGEHVIHNPLTGSDEVLYRDEDETEPIPADCFKEARAKAIELFPNADIRGV
jgi:hypothetical protein